MAEWETAPAQKSSDGWETAPSGKTAEHPSVIGSMVKPIGDWARNTATDFNAGREQVVRGLKEEGARSSASIPGSILPGKETADVGMGLAQMIGSPATGGGKTVAGMFDKIIPQDTTYGKLAHNSIEAAVSMFGPGVAGELANTLAATAKTATSPVKMLMDHGVTLTLGQLEPKIAKRMEEAAKSVPILGSFIRSAEGRSLDSFNVATANKALEPIGVKLDAKDGREAIQKGQAALDAAYSKTLSKVPALHQDTAFDAAITNLKSMVKEMPPDKAAQFDAILDNRVYQRFGQLKTMDGRTFKGVESELTNIASSAKSSSDNAERQLGYAVDEVRAAMRDALGRQYPMLAPELQDINHAYGRFADVERAASASAMSGARFTPGNLLTSIRRADKSPRDRQFAAGNRPMQDWAEAAHKVLGNKLPDSGTSERAMWDIGGMGAASTGAVLGHPGALMGIGGAASLYTKPGQAVVNWGAENIPAAMRGAGGLLTKSGPAAAISETNKQLGITP